MTLKELKKQIGNIVLDTLGKELDLGKLDVSLAADLKYGDVATNAAMVYAKELGRAPRVVAEELAEAIKSAVPGMERVEIAGPGFINMTFSDKALVDSAESALDTRPATYRGKVVVAEYGDPNPFKILHAGHLYTDIVGDAVANLMELSGGTVHRVNFGGDVGLHVAKAMWAILRTLGGDDPQALDKIPEDGRAEWMTKAYVEGTAAYDESDSAGADPQTKLDIMLLNKIVYDVWSDDHDMAGTYNFPSITGNQKAQLNVGNIQSIYRTCRQWSYDYFAYFYDRLGSHFEKYYPESENAHTGLRVVREQLKKGVYEESDGAVVFKGEKYGLHTRVFVTREGLPTYEAKDVGLVMAKWKDYHFDTSLIITANDQAEYMKVVVKSIEQFMPELANRTVHLTHGVLKLAGGMKMSSRKGNILRATDILDAAAEANALAQGKDDPVTSVAAVKYAMLKQRIGGDIVYDPVESVSLEGNSGPYLQYAHARARSILAKAQARPVKVPTSLEEGERILTAKIAEYPDVVTRAVEELMPHHVATYLYELAQIFNRFYEGNRVVGDTREAYRLKLVTWYADVLRDGLGILGIVAPDRL